jgi:hypothetical protein
MRFRPLQRLAVRAALCGAASFRTIPLRRCPPAQWLALAVFRSRPKSPPSAHLWPVSSSPAVFLGTDSTRPPLSWVIRRLLSSAWRTGPMNASVRHGLAALLSRSGSARGVLSFAVLLRPTSARKAFRISPPAVLSIRLGLGLFYPKDRPACSVIVAAGQSRLLGRGFWVFRRVSRTVPTRRDRPLLPWTSPLPGLSGAFRFVAELRAGRVSSPCASRRFPVLGGPRRPTSLEDPSAHELGPFTARSSACWRNRRLF